MSTKKINTDLETDAILSSLGLLNEEEKKIFNSKVSKLSKTDKKIVSEFNNLTSLLPSVFTDDKKIAPTASAKKNLFEKINSSSVKNKQDEKNFEFIFEKKEDWFQHPLVSGIKVKQLALNKEKGYVMLLMKVAAGSQYPQHHHHGAEECYVVEGDLYVQGKLLGPGDFHHAESGTNHEPLYTKNGCTVILVVDPADY